MNVKVKLIILSIDLDQKDVNCFLYLDDFIKQSITEKCGEIDSFLKNILLKFFDIDVAWVKFSLIDVKKENKDLVVYYSCMIPKSMKVKKGKWDNMGNLNDKNKESVFNAIQKII